MNGTTDRQINNLKTTVSEVPRGYTTQKYEFVEKGKIISHFRKKQKKIHIHIFSKIGVRYLLVTDVVISTNPGQNCILL